MPSMAHPQQSSIKTLMPASRPLVGGNDSQPYSLKRKRWHSHEAEGMSQQAQPKYPRKRYEANEVQVDQLLGDQHSLQSSETTHRRVVTNCVILPTNQSTVIRSAPDDSRNTPRKATRTSSAENRSAALLQRLVDKQKLKSVLDVEFDKSPRKRALHRLVQVSSAISSEGLGNSVRRSFTVQVLTQMVKQSLSSVISQSELLDVLRLLQSEEKELGCPGFVRFVAVGSATAIVVDAAKRPSYAELEAKVEGLLKHSDRL